MPYNYSLKHLLTHLITMTTAKLNQLFLNSITPEMNLIVLSNIANHYGISNEDAKNEILDEEAESIMDYITGSTRSAISVIYQRFLISIK